jgi:hypothetical protein
MEHYIKISRRAAIHTRFTLSSYTKLLAIIYAGRNLDVDFPSFLYLAGAPACRALLLNFFASTTTIVANSSVYNLAKWRILFNVQLARSMAVAACFRLGARLRP